MMPDTSAQPPAATGIPREVPGTALGRGRPSGWGWGCLSLRPTSASSAACTPPTPQPQQQGPCDIRVTQGRAPGIPSLSLTDTCHLSHPHQPPPPLSPQWEEPSEGLNIPPPRAPLASGGSSLYLPPRLVAAPPAKAWPKRNNEGPETSQAKGLPLCSPG